MSRTSIIFNDESINRIRECKKTQTRRMYSRNYAHKLTNNPPSGLREKVDIKWTQYQVGDVLNVLESNAPINEKAKPTLTDVLIKVTNVRLERLHEIHTSDIFREGIVPRFGKVSTDVSSLFYWEKVVPDNALEDFTKIWNSIYNNWDDNPWVLVIDFEVITHV